MNPITITESSNNSTDSTGLTERTGEGLEHPKSNEHVKNIMLVGSGGFLTLVILSIVNLFYSNVVSDSMCLSRPLRDTYYHSRRPILNSTQREYYSSNSNWCHGGSDGYWFEPGNLFYPWSQSPDCKYFQFLIPYLPDQLPSSNLIFTQSPQAAAAGPYFDIFNEKTKDEYGEYIDHFSMFSHGNSSYLKASSVPSGYKYSSFDMSFLYGRTVILLGDSQERVLIESLCRTLASINQYPYLISLTFRCESESYPDVLAHLNRKHDWGVQSLYIEEWDFLLMNMMIFGAVPIAQAPWYDFVHKPAPFYLQYMAPFLSQYFPNRSVNSIDLVIMNSLLWDLAAFSNVVDKNEYASSIIDHLIKPAMLTFPNSTYGWRTGPHSHNYDFDKSRQLNSIGRMVAKKMGLFLFDFERLAGGMETDLKYDGTHMGPRLQFAYLNLILNFLNMLFQK